MEFIIVVFTLVITWGLALGRVKDTLSKGIVFCFLGYWSLSLILSTFNPSSLFNVSISAYILLLAYVLFFVVGFSSFHPKNFKVSANAGIFSIDGICNSWLFRILYILVVSFGIKTLIIQRVALAFYSTGNIKIDPMNLLFEGSRLQYYFYDLICLPFYYFTMALFSYMIFYQKSYRLTKMALLLLIVVYSLIGGGRATVILVAFFLVFFLFSGERISATNSNIKRRKISLKAIIISLIVGLFLFFGMVYITYIGLYGIGHVDANDFFDTSGMLVDQILVYSLGPFRAFDYALSHPEIFLKSGFHFIRASFCGFDYLLSLVFGVLGFPFVPINYDTMSVMQDLSIDVGNNISFNYAYTSVLYHYIDFGAIGVCFYGFLFGYLCRKIVLLSYMKSSFYYLVLLSFIFYMLMYSIFSSFFNKDFTVLFIVLLFLMAKKEKRYLRYE